MNGHISSPLDLLDEDAYLEVILASIYPIILGLGMFTVTVVTNPRDSGHTRCNRPDESRLCGAGRGKVLCRKSAPFASLKLHVIR
jgi:hypothetical protein